MLKVSMATYYFIMEMFRDKRRGKNLRMRMEHGRSAFTAVILKYMDVLDFRMLGQSHHSLLVSLQHRVHDIVRQKSGQHVMRPGNQNLMVSDPLAYGVKIMPSGTAGVA